MPEINYMPTKEFREKGYLQEINRTFLHPLGLALEIIIEEDGTEKLGGIWDYRNDPEGIIYALDKSSVERIEAFTAKKRFIDKEFIKRSAKREQILGYVTEPIPEVDNED